MIPTFGFDVQSIPTVSIMRRTMSYNSGRCTIITVQRSQSVLIFLRSRNDTPKCSGLNGGPNVRSTLIMVSFPKRSLNVLRGLRRCMTTSEREAAGDVSGICIKIPFETPFPKRGRDISVIHVLKGSASAKTEDIDSCQFRN